MKIDLLMDFTVDKANNKIQISREFAAKRQLVWNAYTHPEIMDLWWAPKPWKARTKSMDFKEGGHWHYAMVGPNGEEHWAWCSYIKIDPIEKYMGTDLFADADGNPNLDLPQSNWEVTFVDCGEITLVEYVLTFPDLAQLEATIKMGFKEGITMSFDNLDDIFATQ